MTSWKDFLDKLPKKMSQAALARAYIHWKATSSQSLRFAGVGWDLASNTGDISDKAASATFKTGELPLMYTNVDAARRFLIKTYSVYEGKALMALAQVEERTPVHATVLNLSDFKESLDEMAPTLDEKIGAMLSFVVAEADDLFPRSEPPTGYPSSRYPPPRPPRPPPPPPPEPRGPPSPDGPPPGRPLPEPMPRFDNPGNGPSMHGRVGDHNDLANSSCVTTSNVSHSSLRK